MVRFPRIVISLAAVVAFSCAAQADTAPLPRSLVSRMLDARENFVAPKRPMCLEADVGADAAKWPFNIARIEGLLEKILDRTEEGSYCLRRDAGEGDPREKSAAALAYVNKVIADWAMMQLDLRFDRCDAKTVMALAGYRVDLDPNFWHSYAILTKKGLFGGGAAKVGGWVAAWKVADQLYFVLTSELSTEGRPRDYQFVRWDGAKDWPIAGFEEFPDAQRALTIMRVTTNPVAANNLAALLHAREANRRIYMPEYIEQLLRRSAAGGCETAFHNLGVFMEEQGDAEQAKAFFSRETR